MRCGFAFLLVAVVTAGCSREDAHRSVNDTTDSMKLVTSEYKAFEKAIWEYYVSIEEEVSKDLGVTEEEIVKHVQSLIDDGYVKKPAILVIIEGGARWATVDYPTYKEYMTSSAIVLRRYYGTQPDILDTVSMDSIRNHLLKALKSKDVPSDAYDALP